MWYFRIINIFFLVVCITGAGTAHEKEHIHASGFRFIENKGQWPENVLFYTQVEGGAIFFEKDRITFSFYNTKQVHDILHFKYLEGHGRDNLLTPDPVIDCHAYCFHFRNHSEACDVLPREMQSTYFNYFKGNDPDKWAGNVKSYNSIVYVNLWEGIDLHFYGKDHQLKYDIIANEPDDLSKVQFLISGAKNMGVSNGQFRINTSVNTFIHARPVSWQNMNGTSTEIDCRYRLQDQVLSYQLKGRYDPHAQTVIDPVLIFSSYSGSVSDNWGYTATYDDNGFLYAGGATFAQGYPVTIGAYQAVFGGGFSDIAISKYDTTGSVMIYSTYLGGSGTEVPNSLVVNKSGELLVLATTGSSDYPVTPSAFDHTFNGGTSYTLTYVMAYGSGSDIAVSRFSSDGTALLASTYIGGSGNDGFNTAGVLKHNYADDVRGEIIVDKNNNIYIGSSTKSSDFPVTTGAFQAQFGGGGQDGCIIKMDNSLTTMIWASYYGGSGSDAIYSLVLDQNNNLFFAGGTTSTDLPVTSGAFQPNYGGGSCDGFVASCNLTGSILLHSSYYGMNVYDQIYFVETDRNNNIYVLGQTAASGTSYIQNVSWYTPGGGQFISKFNNSLSSRVWSTAFGTGNSGPDVSPTAFMIDFCDNIYLSAWGSPSLNGFGGTSGMPVTMDGFQLTTDNNDYYFMVLNGNASNLVYATFFGGSSAEHVDGGTSRFDRKGRIYQSVCAGCGGYDDFPTTSGAWSNINGSFNCNNAVIKFDFKLPLVVADFPVPQTGCTPYSVQFTNNSLVTGSPGYSVFWDFGDGAISSQWEPVHTYTQSGIYEVTLIISDTGACNHSDTLVQQFVVLSGTSSTLDTVDICAGEYAQIGILPVPDTSLSYTWYPSTGLTDIHAANPLASPAVSTLYTMVLSNSICADTLFQFVDVHDLMVDAGNDTLLCTPDLTLHATSLNNNVSYIWSSTRYFTDTLNSGVSDPEAFVTLSQEGYFYVKVFDEICEAVDSVYVGFMLLISPIASQDPSCYGYLDGTAIVEVIGGTPPFSYLWNTGSINDTLTELSSGSYTVTITDAQQCISVKTITLEDPTPLVTDPMVRNVPCHEICMGSIQLQPSGSHPPYTFVWSNGETSDYLENLCDGDYYVTITDQNQCIAYDTIRVSTESVFTDVRIISSRDTIYKGQQVLFQATELENVSYYWTPVDYITDFTVYNPIARPEFTTTFYLTMTDQYGCLYSDSLHITVLELICDEPYIYIPNAFSPNGDGKNDILYVRSAVVYGISFQIFSRWGELLFESSDLNSGWDGNYKGKKCEAGVYVYQLKAYCFDTQIFEKKGNVTLLR